MDIVEEALRRIAQDLAAMDVRWALVGGFAVSVRAEPRFTRDVDIAISVADDRAAEQVVHDLVAASWPQCGGPVAHLDHVPPAHPADAADPADTTG